MRHKINSFGYAFKNHVAWQAPMANNSSGTENNSQKLQTSEIVENEANFISHPHVNI